MKQGLLVAGCVVAFALLLTGCAVGTLVPDAAGRSAGSIGAQSGLSRAASIFSFGGTGADSTTGTASTTGPDSTAGSGTSTAPMTCSTYYIRVKMTAISFSTYQVHGKLCYSSTADARTVQLLVHGATYNGAYWDFRTIDPERYSYVMNAAQKGFVTFTIDRLGSGSSDKPDGTTNTVDTAAYVLHQIVQSLLAGRIGGVKYRQVMLVGHSLGSIISIVEDATYHDASALLLTGFSHSLNPAAATSLADFLYPTQLDSQFGLFSPPGYVTTIPGTRSTLFYNTSDADSDVIAYDERHKDELALGQAELLTTIVLPQSLQIHVPVFLMNGSRDFLFCGGLVDCSSAQGLKSFEAPYFSKDAQLQTDIVPYAGHDLNLHLNAGTAYEKMFQWISAVESSG